MTVQPIPEGFHTVNPYLAIRGVDRLIEFLKEGFGAELASRHAMPDGRVMNAIVRIGDSMVLMGEAAEGQPTFPGMLYVYVEDTDALYERAVAAGGKSVMEPADQFYGDRNAAVEDPSGNQWWIATHVEDISDEELVRRAGETRGSDA